MKKRNGREVRRGRLSMSVDRRDGSLRQARATRAKDPRQRVAFPIVVEFARGAPTPRIESLVAMHACAQWLARHRDELVTLVGHANLRGSETAAKALARERVAAVTDLLVLLGSKRNQLVPLRSARLQVGVARLGPPAHPGRHRRARQARRELEERGRLLQILGHISGQEAAPNQEEWKRMGGRPLEPMSVIGCA